MAKVTFVTHRSMHLVAGLAVLLAACSSKGTDKTGGATGAVTAGKDASSFITANERHLTNLRQLTFGGENAEAYYAFDGSKLIYQAHKPGTECDQIYIMDLATGESHLVSTGKGRTTCSYFYPKGDKILYSSTHLAGDACPPPPDMSKGYVWAVYKSYDVFEANVDGSDLHQLTSTETWTSTRWLRTAPT